MRHTFDLNDFDVSRINVYIHTNGEIHTYSQDGIPIKEFCGNLTKLHDIIPMTLGVNRRSWYEEKYGEPRTPSIVFKICHVDENGDKSYTKGIITEQLKQLLQYIKKK